MSVTPHAYTVYTELFLQCHTVMRYVSFIVSIILKHFTESGRRKASIILPSDRQVLCHILY